MREYDPDEPPCDDHADRAHEYSHAGRYMCGDCFIDHWQTCADCRAWVAEHP